MPGGTFPLAVDQAIQCEIIFVLASNGFVANLRIDSPGQRSMPVIQSFALVAEKGCSVQTNRRETIMAVIRPLRPDDLPALYAICLETGFKGGDASHLYADPHLIGHIYAAPYAVLDPQMALVFEDSLGVAGYVVGAIDTVHWENRLEDQWWPALRQRYADPPKKSPESWSPDERRVSMIHHPARTPAWVVSPYPAHMHMNLLPRAQGEGVGTRLFQQWIKLAADQGAEKIHVGVNSANDRGFRFWAKRGFSVLVSEYESDGRTTWMGLGRASV